MISSGRPECQNSALIDDIRVIANAKGLAHIVIGDQHANPAILQEPDDALNVDHCDRIDAREWFIEQNESRIGGQGTCDFYRRRSPPDRLIDGAFFNDQYAIRP